MERQRVESFLEYIIKNEKILSENNIKLDYKYLKDIIEIKKNNEYNVSVFGTMKAGKSTFINALIGEELMPSENAACTLTTTNIRHSKNSIDRIIKEYEDHTQFIIEGEDLLNKFHQDIRETRKNRENIKFRYKIEHQIKSLINIESYGNLNLVDTPGLNEMEGLGVSRKEIEFVFNEQLKRSNFIIYIFDYKYYKSQENIEILERIKKLRPDIIENNNIVFVINKIDLITYKDGNLDIVIDEINRMLENIGLKNNKIYSISAKKALLARIIKNGNNIDKYNEEIEEFRPIIKKEIDGQILDIKLPIKDMEIKLLIESNIQEFENEVIVHKYLKIKHELNKSVNKIEENILKKLSKQLLETNNHYKSKIKIYDETYKKYIGKIEFSKEKLNKVGEDIQKINELLKIPTYEEAMKKEMLDYFCVKSDYIYPYCEYDEFYKSERSARSAAVSKFVTWKNTIKLEFDNIYKYYNNKLTGSGFNKSLSTEISTLLGDIAKNIEHLLKNLGEYSDKKIITTINVVLEPIMNLNYDNSSYYIREFYDNSNFISFDYSERYVKGIFGERLKDVVTYDISDAIRNEENDYEEAFKNSSSDFFEDYYEKKYRRFIPRIKEIVDKEIEKSEEIFDYIFKKNIKELEEFKAKNQETYEKSLENLEKLEKIFNRIGE